MRAQAARPNACMLGVLRAQGVIPDTKQSTRGSSSKLERGDRRTKHQRTVTRLTLLPMDHAIRSHTTHGHAANRLDRPQRGRGGGRAPPTCAHKAWWAAAPVRPPVTQLHCSVASCQGLQGLLTPGGDPSGVHRGSGITKQQLPTTHMGGAATDLSACAPAPPRWPTRTCAATPTPLGLIYAYVAVPPAQNGCQNLHAASARHGHSEGACSAASRTHAAGRQRAACPRHPRTWLSTPLVICELGPGRHPGPDCP